MKAKFICHKDFSALLPFDMFHKEETEKYIPPHPEHLKNRHTLFRKRITLENTQNAVLKISADDRYKLYINGQFVTEGPSPAYPSAYYYNELDVSRYLCKGENTFAFHTYYQGLINRVWVSGDLRSMLWCELCVDGKPVMASDESFLCTVHTGYSACGVIGYDTAFAECYDSNSAEDRFFECDFDDSAWERASVFAHADYILKKQPTKQLEYERIQPMAVKNTENGLQIDFGRESVGYMHLTAHGNKNDTLILRFGEELNDDGSVRYKLRANCKYEEKWILSGGRDILRPYDYKAFRYAEIICPDTVTVDEIYMSARHYPFTQRATYTTENEKLKKILTLCADTVKYGTQEVFVDCPTREKGQYLGDVSISARAQAVLTGDTAMIKKAIFDFCESAFICKGLMAVSTASKMQEIADYSLQLPAQVAWVYALDGDIEFVRQTEPYITDLYRYMRKYENADGLISGVIDKWNLVDWPDNLRDGYSFDLTRPIGEGLHNVINAFWCGFLQAVDEIYSLLGMPETGKTERAKQAFTDAFYSHESGLFCDAPDLLHSAVHSNILPLLFDIGTQDSALCDRLAEFIYHKGLDSMGVYMAYFALAALVSHGYRDIAEELAVSDKCWLNMIEQGATATFEAWGKEQKGNCSLFHPWAAAPAIVFADGIRIY